MAESLNPIIIKGQYKIITDGWDPSSYDSSNDVLYVIYNGYPHMATPDPFGDPLSDEGCQFTVSFQTEELDIYNLTLALRSRFNDAFNTFTLYDQSIVADNFFERTIEINPTFLITEPETQISDVSGIFVYGCTNPLSLDYNGCAHIWDETIDNSAYETTEFDFCTNQVPGTCTDPNACTCDNELCYSYNDDFELVSDCEYCGTDLEWKCVDEEGYYNRNINALPCNDDNSCCHMPSADAKISIHYNNYSEDYFNNSSVIFDHTFTGSESGPVESSTSTPWTGRGTIIIKIDNVRNADFIKNFNFEIDGVRLTPTYTGEFYDGCDMLTGGFTGAYEQTGGTYNSWTPILIDNQGSKSIITSPTDPTSFGDCIQFEFKIDDIIKTNMCINNFVAIATDSDDNEIPLRVEIDKDFTCLYLNPDEALYNKIDNLRWLGGKLYKQDITLHRGNNRISPYVLPPTCGHFEKSYMELTLNEGWYAIQFSADESDGLPDRDYYPPKLTEDYFGPGSGYYNVKPGCVDCMTPGHPLNLFWMEGYPHTSDGEIGGVEHILRLQGLPSTLEGLNISARYDIYSQGASNPDGSLHIEWDEFYNEQFGGHQLDTADAIVNWNNSGKNGGMWYSSIDGTYPDGFCINGEGNFPCYDTSDDSAGLGDGSSESYDRFWNGYTLGKYSNGEGWDYSLLPDWLQFIEDSPIMNGVFPRNDRHNDLNCDLHDMGWYGRANSCTMGDGVDPTSYYDNIWEHLYFKFTNYGEPQLEGNDAHSAQHINQWMGGQFGNEGSSNSIGLDHNEPFWPAQSYRKNVNVLVELNDTSGGADWYDNVVTSEDRDVPNIWMGGDVFYIKINEPQTTIAFPFAFVAFKCGGDSGYSIYNNHGTYWFGDAYSSWTNWEENWYPIVGGNAGYEDPRSCFGINARKIYTNESNINHYLYPWNTSNWNNIGWNTDPTSPTLYGLEELYFNKINPPGATLNLQFGQGFEDESDISLISECGGKIEDPEEGSGDIVQPDGGYHTYKSLFESSKFISSIEVNTGKPSSYTDNDYVLMERDPITQDFTGTTSANLAQLHYGNSPRYLSVCDYTGDLEFDCQFNIGPEWVRNECCDGAFKKQEFQFDIQGFIPPFNIEKPEPIFVTTVEEECEDVGSSNPTLNYANCNQIFSWGYTCYDYIYSEFIGDICQESCDTCSDTPIYDYYAGQPYYWFPYGTGESYLKELPGYEDVTSSWPIFFNYSGGEGITGGYHQTIYDSFVGEDIYGSWDKTKLWDRAHLGILPPCKEYLYEKMSTILSFNNTSPRDYVAWGNQVGIIEYETELISQVDTDRDQSYDIWLGTKTDLYVGEGYTLKSGFEPLDSEGKNSFKVDMYYDQCGVCSGGSTLHSPNSDVDDFGYCCLYPHEIIEWYQEDINIQLGIGKSYMNTYRLCSDTAMRDAGVDQPYNLQGLNYYKNFDSCNGVLDCIGECHQNLQLVNSAESNFALSSNTFTQYDKFGQCCAVGNIDQCGICDGNNTSCEVECTQIVGSAQIYFANGDITNDENNSGSFDIVIENSSPFKELKFRIQGVSISSGNVSVTSSNTDIYPYTLYIDLVEGSEYTYQNIRLGSLQDPAQVESGTHGLTLHFDDIYLPQILIDQIEIQAPNDQLLNEPNSLTSNELVIYGCADELANNYNSVCASQPCTSVECEYTNFDCAGTINGELELDHCGVCGGVSVCNGNVTDGQCDSTCNFEEEDSAFDCNCTCFGDLVQDCQDVCGGSDWCSCDPNCLDSLDCFGISGGDAGIDDCGLCIPGFASQTAESLELANVFAYCIVGEGPSVGGPQLDCNCVCFGIDQIDCSGQCGGINYWDENPAYEYNNELEQSQCCTGATITGNLSDCNPPCIDGQYCSLNVGGTEYECFDVDTSCIPMCDDDHYCLDGTCVLLPTACTPLCNDGEVCINNTCYIVDTTCTPPCLDTQACVDGTCYNYTETSCDPPCTDGEYCNGGSCYAVNNTCSPSCNDGEYCIDGTCYPNPSDCPQGCANNQYCFGGDCYNYGASCNPSCEDDQFCHDFGEGGICVNVSTLCNPGCNYDEFCRDTECAESADDDSDGICNDGSFRYQCIPITSSCYPLCSDGQYCVDGSCYTGTASGCTPGCADQEFCFENSCHTIDSYTCWANPCSDEHYCYEGTCYHYDNSCHPPCDEGYTCIAGVCYEASICDPVCVDPEVCIDDTCILPEGICEPPCSPGYQCINGQCIMFETTCSPPCPDSFYCYNSQCYSMTINICEPACEEGSYCYNGTCTAYLSGDLTGDGVLNENDLYALDVFLDSHYDWCNWGGSQNSNCCHPLCIGLEECQDDIENNPFLMGCGI